MKKLLILISMICLLLLGSLFVSAAGKVDLIDSIVGFSPKGIAIGDPGVNGNLAIGDPGVNDNFAKFAIKEQGVKKQKTFLLSNFKFERIAPISTPPSIAIGEPGTNNNGIAKQKLWTPSNFRAVNNPGVKRTSIAIGDPGVNGNIAIDESGVHIVQMKAKGVNAPVLLRAVNNSGVTPTSIAIGDPGVNGNRVGIGHAMNVKEIAIDEQGVHFSEIAIDEPGVHRTITVSGNNVDTLNNLIR